MSDIVHVLAQATLTGVSNTGVVEAGGVLTVRVALNDAYGNAVQAPGGALVNVHMVPEAELFQTVWCFSDAGSGAY